MKTGHAFLVIVSEEASENTKKKFRNMCEYYHVPIYFYGMKDELGKAMGKEMRASLAVQDAEIGRASCRERVFVPV